MGTSYIGFGNDTPAKLPDVAEGEEVPCGDCSGMHPLRCGRDEEGEKSNLLLFYSWAGSGKTYLGAINGKLMMFKNPDVSGNL